MSSKVEHKKQFEHNLDFVKIFYLGSNTYLDWVVTVHFYAAVHLIEAFLAQRGIHSSQHSERNREVHQNLRQINNDYQRLYLASRRTRYQVWMPTDIEVQVLILNHFEPLKNYLLTNI